MAAASAIATTTGGVVEENNYIGAVTSHRRGPAAANSDNNVIKPPGRPNTLTRKNAKKIRALYSKFRSRAKMKKLIQNSKYNLFLYFVHGQITQDVMSVEDNNIVIQTGAGESFGCTVHIEIDSQIIQAFGKNRANTFPIFLGYKGNETHGILDYFLYNVPNEKTYDKHVSLIGDEKYGKWGVFLLNQTNNQFEKNDTITNYLLGKKYTGMKSSELIKFVNTNFKKGTNIHVFPNCASTAKGVNLKALFTIIPSQTHFSNPTIVKNVKHRRIIPSGPTFVPFGSSGGFVTRRKNKQMDENIRRKMLLMDRARWHVDFVPKDESSWSKDQLKALKKAHDDNPASPSLRAQWRWLYIAKAIPGKTWKNLKPVQKSYIEPVKPPTMAGLGDYSTAIANYGIKTQAIEISDMPQKKHLEDLRERVEKMASNADKFAKKYPKFKTGFSNINKTLKKHLEPISDSIAHHTAGYDIKSSKFLTELKKAKKSIKTLLKAAKAKSPAATAPAATAPAATAAKAKSPASTAPAATAANPAATIVKKPYDFPIPKKPLGGFKRSRPKEEAEYETNSDEEEAAYETDSDEEEAAYETDSDEEEAAYETDSDEEETVHSSSAKRARTGLGPYNEVARNSSSNSIPGTRRSPRKLRRRRTYKK